MSRTAPFPCEPATPPVPLSAVFDQSESAAYITFDQPIAAVTPGNWNATTFIIEQMTGQFQTGSVSIPNPAQPEVVRVEMIGTVPIGGPAVASYDDLLATLVGVNGLPVASFVNLPCPPQP